MWKYQRTFTIGHGNPPQFIEKVHALPFVVEIRQVLDEVARLTLGNRIVFPRPASRAYIVHDIDAGEGDAIDAEPIGFFVGTAADVQADGCGFFECCVHKFLQYIVSGGPKSPRRS